MEDEIRILRVIEYVGPRSRVEQTVARSIHGTKDVGNGLTIRAATLGEFAEILAAGKPTYWWHAESEAVLMATTYAGAKNLADLGCDKIDETRYIELKAQQNDPSKRSGL